jgi:hypothetical protein
MEDVECTICEELVVDCYAEESCSAQWCGDWLAACQTWYCEVTSVEIPAAGACTISRWGVGRLVGWGESYVTAGADDASPVASCEGNPEGFVVLGEHEIELCADTCASFLDAGTLSVDVYGYCE